MFSRRQGLCGGLPRERFSPWALSGHIAEANTQKTEKIENPQMLDGPRLGQRWAMANSTVKAPSPAGFGFFKVPTIGPPAEPTLSPVSCGPVSFSGAVGESNPYFFGLKRALVIFDL